MRRLLTLIPILLLLGALALPAMAGVTCDGHLRLGGRTGEITTKVGQTSTTTKDTQLQEPKVNLNIKGDVADGVKALVELREEGGRRPVVRQALIELTNLIPGVSLRAGRIKLPSGGLQSVDNANSMENPLIDESISYSDIITLDTGAEATLALDPVESTVTLGIFRGGVPNDKPALLLKGAAKPVEGLDVSLLFYTSDETKKDAGALKDVITTYALTGQYKLPEPALTIKGMVGRNTHEEGDKKPETTCFGLQGSYDFNEMFWGALRFANSTKKEEKKEDSKSTEIAVGGGCNLAENTKIKVQWRSVKDENVGGVKGAEKTINALAGEIVVAF